MGGEMKHVFEYDEQAECSICVECGYVWGETPHQNCPMKIGGRNAKDRRKRKRF